MVLQVWGLQNHFTKKTSRPRSSNRLTYLESEMYFVRNIETIYNRTYLCDYLKLSEEIVHGKCRNKP